MCWVLKNPFYSRISSHGSLLEFVWTVVPLVLLVAIAVPSMSYLYVAEASLSPALRVKVVGHQWYWTYYFRDLGVQLDSYIKRSAAQFLGDSFLLETESPCVVPINTSLQFLVTREDVLHSWTLPNLGVKVDAIPGVLSSVNLVLSFPGLYLGMCREMCGALHRYMPINLEGTPIANWVLWVKNMY